MMRQHLNDISSGSLETKYYQNLLSEVCGRVDRDYEKKKRHKPFVALMVSGFLGLAGTAEA